MKIKSKVVLLFIAIFTILLFQYSPSGTFDNVPEAGLEKAGAVIDKTNRTGSLKPDINYGNIPLYFIHNEGQVNKNALFYAKTPGYTLWITKEGLVFDSVKHGSKTNSKFSIPNSKLNARSELKIQNSKLSSRDVSRLLFVGANKDVKIEPLEMQKLKVNYFKGNDKTKWRGNIPTSGAVIYKNIYKNIDLKVYGIGKQIEYDWIVKPGGDPSDIKFEYKNIKKIKINKKGDLDIKTQFSTLIHKKPFAYQNIGVGVGSPNPVMTSNESIINQTNSKGGGTPPLQEISSSFKKISNTTFGFKTGKYDKNKTLIIDPVVLAYSTYLGGDLSDFGKAITVDQSGSAYVTGYTNSSDFPTLNHYQGIHLGSNDVFVTKLSPSGNSLVYSTYLGGNDVESGEGIAVDQSGSAYVTGGTNSTNFPTQNQFQGDHQEQDAFITKLSPSGNSLEYSTYLGGVLEDFGEGITVDSSGSAYVTGHTESFDFPLQNPIQGYQGGMYDAFITKLSPSGNSLVYSTILGGIGRDYGHGVAIDLSGAAYVIGFTASPDFPTLNQYQGDQAAGDVFITKLSPSGDSLVYSTYLGGNDDESGYGIAVDQSGYAYLTGITKSTNFPTQNQFQGDQPGQDVFITRLSPSGNSLVYSTYLGGNDYDKGTGIAVDQLGYTYVSGDTRSSDFPSLNQYQEDQPKHDIFITKFSPTGQTLVYSTYLGAQGDEFVGGMAIDETGSTYVTGLTTSSGFPTVNEYQKFLGGINAFVTKLVMEYTINASVSGGNGSVSPLSQTVNEGNAATIDITPEKGYAIANIVDNGSNVPIRDPYRIINVRENHEVVVTFEKIKYKVTASVPGGNGSVSPEFQKIEYGENAAINIYPSAGYKIGSITDNGNSVPVSNPYVIFNVLEKHSILVEFIPDAYPPELALTGVRKTEHAWIIKKDYAELNISITEHPVNPVQIDKFVLLKSNNGLWTVVVAYSSSGNYIYIDKALERGRQVNYKLVAYLPNGTIAVETNILTL